MATIEELAARQARAQREAEVLASTTQWDFLTVERVHQQKDIVIFVALLTSVFSLAALLFSLRRAALDTLRRMKKIKFAPRSPVVYGFLLAVALTGHAASSLIALLQPVRGQPEGDIDIVAMLSFTATLTLMGFFVPSYLYVGDLSLALMSLMFAFGANLYQIHRLSEKLYITVYLQSVALVIVFYFTVIVTKQWLATELPIAMKQLNWDLPALNKLMKVDDKKRAKKVKPKFSR